MTSIPQRVTPLEALQAVRRFFRTEVRMAVAFEVTQPTVWRWLNRTKQMPAEYVLHAERLTGVSRHDLRPDIYPRDYPPAPDHGSVGAGPHRLSAGAK